MYQGNLFKLKWKFIFSCDIFFLTVPSSPISQQKQSQKTLSEEVHVNADVHVTDKQRDVGDSYKKQLMDQLDKKVEEKSKFNL